MGVYLAMGIPPPVELAAISSSTNCSIDQNIQIKYVAEQIANKVTQIINEDANAIELANSLETYTKEENVGLGGVFESIGKGFNNIFTGGSPGTGTIVSIASSCSSCILVIIAGGAFMMSPQGKSMGMS